VIETQSLGKMYGRGMYALRDLNLKVDRGEFAFLTGPSGAGKSTFLRLLLLEERPSEGEVIVAGRNLSHLTRDEIQDHLWGDAYAAGSNMIDRHVHSLRAKLHDDWHRPRYIATVPGLGYRFEPPPPGRGAGRRRPGGPTEQTQA